MSAQPVDDPAEVLAVYTRARPAHPYGIADVVQLWDRSRWWRDGPAVVGVLDLPGAGEPVVYAIAASRPERTLALLGALAGDLPERFMATGPPGMVGALAPVYDAAFERAYVKMHLADPDELAAPGPAVVRLGIEDLSELEQLFAADPEAGDFFHPGLLDSGIYVGHREATLVAAGGTHVVEDRHGVAAIGNVATDPEHRRRGLARAVVSTLCRLLSERVDVIGLNVRRDNPGGVRLYEGLGFRTVLPYSEALLVRR